MKKFLLTLFVCILSVFAYSNEVIERGEYDNGNTKYELVAIPGIDGDTYEYKEYYVTGELYLKGHYNEYGRKSGTWINYYMTGQIETYRFYSNGDEHGTWWVYDEDGSVICSYQYKRGERHGEWLHYNESGDLLSKREYKKGKKHGEWKFYDENGRLLLAEDYNRDKLIKGWEWSESQGLIARYP